jgi:hypothetical protein
MIKKLHTYDNELLMPYFSQFNKPLSDLTLTNVMMWNDKYDTHYMIIDSFLILVYSRDKDEVYYSQPIGDYSDDSKWLDCIRILLTLNMEKKTRLFLRNTDKKTAQLIQQHFEGVSIHPSPEHNDYCYLSEDLSSLIGNKYHKKKNHVNQFIHHYGDDHTIEVINKENAKECVVCASNWCESKKCDESKDLCYEFSGIKLVLEHWEDYSVEGLLIKHDNIVIGFAFGEPLSENYFVIHIEKADTSFQGIYPYLNQLTATHVKNRFTYINREQDLGIAGLMKAKQSYHPDHYIEKFNVIIKTV